MALHQEAAVHFVWLTRRPRECSELSHRQDDSSLEGIPREGNESNLMELGIGLLERKQEEILRAVGPFSGRKSRIFTLPGAPRKRADSI